MKHEYAPFSFSFTEDVPDLLAQLNCSLVLSTYQAGKLIVLSPQGEAMVQLTRNFKKPMGLAVDGERLAVATQFEIVVLGQAKKLADGYPKKPKHYDTLYVPRGTFFTGQIDVHDMAWAGDTLWGVNTRFSCLCTFDMHHSFRPAWTPYFISDLQPEDRCHLNGMVLEDGTPRYVTALGRTDHRKGWREHRQTGGIVMDVLSNEIVLNGLPMPHSPRLIRGKLFIVTSADGALLCIDPERGTATEVLKVPGFARGLSQCGDYLFVAHSRIRSKHAFSDLPIAKQEQYPGVTIIHYPTGKVAGSIRYLASCEEIYDVYPLIGVGVPGLLGVMHDIHRRGIVMPSGAWWTRPRKKAGEAKAITTTERT